jgi:hypothetical protein
MLRAVGRRAEVVACQFDWAPAEARTISCNSSTRIGRHSTERIIPEARRKLRKAERAGTLPKQKAPAGLPATEIFRRYNLAVPPALMTSVLWSDMPTDHVMTDGLVRDKALDIALNELMARPV